MPFVADLHIHSKYSRATSKFMDLENISRWAKIKGVDLVGTGDFTHPEWLKEIEKKTTLSQYGIYEMEKTRYMLTAEVNNIYSNKDKPRRIHNIIFCPSIETAKKINKMLGCFGNLSYDGRPVLKMSCKLMVKELRNIDKEIFIIPAHAWTPHFSVFGSRSGYNSLEECFEEETENIPAIETGLSSDPGMNRLVPFLDGVCLISNSDAHSPSKLAREATVFKESIDYRALLNILKDQDSKKLLYTIEFYPQEGKYFWDGHRKCGEKHDPEETKTLNGICSKCGGRMTLGVLNRVKALGETGRIDKKERPGVKYAIPLMEIIACIRGKRTESKTVQMEYFNIIKSLGNELDILHNIPEAHIIKKCGKDVADGIMNIRNGNAKISPGFDGEYGTIEFDIKRNKTGEKKNKQLTFI